MSTIKSSDEHLTLNADGASKDIKFQANGVEKASIDSSGNLTVTGNLTSLGIDDNADATAITIDSSENVGIGTGSPTQQLHSYNTNAHRLRVANANYGIDLHQPAGASSPHINAYGTDVSIIFDVNDSEKMRITADGRGLSQFTAKVWVNFDGTGTVGINDSHNVSSITDISTGQYRVNFANNMGNANYSVVSGDNAWGNGWNDAIAVGSISTKRRNESGGYVDAAYVSVLVFGD